MSTLVWIRVLPQGIGRAVQLGDEVKHRSVDGDTLLLTPGCSREVTQDEWEYIQRTQADLLPSIQRLDNGSQPSYADNGEAADQPG